jgi:hypothetical protein
MRRLPSLPLKVQGSYLPLRVESIACTFVADETSTRDSHQSTIDYNMSSLVTDDQYRTELSIAPVGNVTKVNMRHSGDSRSGQVNKTSSMIVEHDNRIGVYQQKWMGDEGRDLEVLGQLIVPKASTRGFLTKQGWHSINSPGLPYTRCPPVEVDLTSRKYADIAYRSEQSNEKYSDPAYYLMQQGSHKRRQAISRIKNRVASDVSSESGDHDKGNTQSNGRQSQSATTKQKRSRPSHTFDDSNSDLSEIPDGLGGASETSAVLIKSKNTTEPNESQRLVSSRSQLSRTSMVPLRLTAGRQLRSSSGSGIASGNKNSHIPEADSIRDKPLTRKTASNRIKLGEYPLDDANESDHGEAKDQSQEGEWKLVAGDITSPPLGAPAHDKLEIHIQHVKTKEERNFKFKRIQMTKIDWNNQLHINSISTWRREIFRRYGIGKKKPNILYTEEEEAWLELCHEKISTAAKDGAEIEMPSIPMIADVFNAFFVRQEKQTASGLILPTREVRDVSSFHGKFTRRNTRLFTLRGQVKDLVDAINTSDRTIYTPIITESELRKYRENGEVGAVDPGDPSNNAALGLSEEQLERHLHQLSGQRKRRKAGMLAESKGGAGSLPQGSTEAKRRKNVST